MTRFPAMRWCDESHVSAGRNRPYTLTRISEGKESRLKEIFNKMDCTTQKRENLENVELVSEI